VSVLVIVLIVVGALLALMFIGGLVAARRRQRSHAGEYRRHLQEADQALEQARAADRGWDRAVMEQAARTAVKQERPGFALDTLDLVLVDDRPGVTEDRAHMIASDGRDRVRVVLSRGEGGWSAEQVDTE
jgi:hypothetical protein